MTLDTISESYFLVSCLHNTPWLSVIKYKILVHILSPPPETSDFSLVDCNFFFHPDITYRYTKRPFCYFEFMVYFS